MEAVKKLSFQEMPQDYSPNKLPEIIKLARALGGQEAVIYQTAAAKPFLFETSRLMIRRFYPEDAAGVHELANNRQNSEMKNFDHQWPTDYKGCKEATDWFCTQENMWAVCLKPEYTLIGMIVFNSVDANNRVDLGHVWHTEYWNSRLDTEAISLMVQYAFEELGADGVYAGNPLECAPQIAPLQEIGMEITETRQASFVNDELGNPIFFTGCKMEITRERWNA
ncbi:GNAT family N-acetyltransferase [Paenibacillus sp. BAC0078]